MKYRCYIASVTGAVSGKINNVIIKYMKIKKRVNENFISKEHTI